MSLTGPDYWRPELSSVMPTAINHKCFYCAAKIRTDPAWMWQGSVGHVYLHLECAADWMLRIGADLARWQKQSGSRFGARA